MTATGHTGKPMGWFRRGATRATPLWVTIAAVAVSAAGPALAWVADARSRDREQHEIVTNCRIRNDGIRNGDVRIDTLVGSLVREVGDTVEANESADRIRADQDALPDNQYVDCDDDGAALDDFTFPIPTTTSEEP